MTLRGATTLVAIALAGAFVAGLVLGRKMANPRMKSWPMSSAPSVRLRDGALVAERRLDPEAQPRQALPSGSKAHRLLSVVVMPRTSGSNQPAEGSPVAGKGVRVDVTLTDNNRAVVSSSDGEVVTATDVFVTPPRTERTTHTLITAYNPVTRDAVLAYSQRWFSLGPVTFEAGALVAYQDRKPGAYALLIARW
jgi:hypothetical protein